MNIIESIKRTGRVIKYTWNDDPALFMALGVLVLLLGGSARAIVYAVEHQQRAWIRDCAQLRPLVECREDAATLFGGSE